MTTFVEGPHTGGFLISEANGHRSRDRVTVASGADLQPGTVLGRITATGKYVQLDPEADDGAEDAAGVLYGAAHAASADQPATAITRDAEVRGSDLVWPDGISAEDKAAAIAQLAGLGIIVR